MKWLTLALLITTTAVAWADKSDSDVRLAIRLRNEAQNELCTAAGIAAKNYAENPPTKEQKERDAQRQIEKLRSKIKLLEKEVRIARSTKDKNHVARAVKTLADTRKAITGLENGTLEVTTIGDKEWIINPKAFLELQRNYPLNYNEFGQRQNTH